MLIELNIMVRRGCNKLRKIEIENEGYLTPDITFQILCTGLVEYSEIYIYIIFCQCKMIESGDGKFLSRNFVGYGSLFDLSTGC